jgi:hypothetical protein
MNYRRAAVAALAAGGLLVLGACGDPDNPQPAAQAQPERGALEARQRMIDAHEQFQQAFADAAAVKRANEAHKQFQEALVEVAGQKARAQYRPFVAGQRMLDAKDHPRYNPSDARASAGVLVTDAKDHPQYNPSDVAASPSAASWAHTR